MARAFARELKNSKHPTTCARPTAALLSRRPNRAFNVYPALRYFPTPKPCITRQCACDSCARRLLTAYRSTTAEPSCARCKQSARPATRMTIGRYCMRRPPHDLLSWACRFHFRSSSNCGSTTDVAELRICAKLRHCPLSFNRGRCTAIAIRHLAIRSRRRPFRIVV
jgi:hypothetical protein